MAEHAQVVRIAHLTPTDGSRDQVESLALELAERAREVPGCFGAQVCSVQERENELVMISRWESEEALSSAIARPGYRQALGELESLVGEAIQTENYISV